MSEHYRFNSYPKAFPRSPHQNWDIYHTIGRHYFVPCWYQTVFCVISHRVTSVSGSHPGRHVYASVCQQMTISQRPELTRMYMHVQTKPTWLWSVVTIWNFLVYLTKLTENWLPTVFCVTSAVLSALQQTICVCNKRTLKWMRHSK